MTGERSVEQASDLAAGEGGGWKGGGGGSNQGGIGSEWGRQTSAQPVIRREEQRRNPEDEEFVDEGFPTTAQLLGVYWVLARALILFARG